MELFLQSVSVTLDMEVLLARRRCTVTTRKPVLVVTMENVMSRDYVSVAVASKALCANTQLIKTFSPCTALGTVEEAPRAHV